MSTLLRSVTWVPDKQFSKIKTRKNADDNRKRAFSRNLYTFKILKDCHFQ